MTARKLTGLQILEELYALPSDDDDSDTEIDEGSKEELHCLDTSVQQPSTSMSISVPTDADFNEEEMDSDCDDSGSNSESEDDNQWSDAISKHLQNLNPVCSNNPEVTALVNSTDNAKSYFDIIFDPEICTQIVEQTYIYVVQQIEKKGCNSPKIQDIHAWIGLLILMGIHQLPELRHYWSSEPLLGIPAAKEIITSKRPISCCYYILTFHFMETPLCPYP